MATISGRALARIPTRFTWGRLALLGAALAVLFLRGLAAMGDVINEAQVLNGTVQGLPTPNARMIPAQYADTILSQMSLHDKIAQMIMIKLIGPTMTTQEAQMVQQQHVGAILAFGDAINTTSQVRRLTSDLQHRASIPLFVATDQEGEYVNRFAPIYGSQPAADQLLTAQNAQHYGTQTATEFTALGFNMDLAPVVDINDPGVTSQLYGRLYSSDPGTVGQMADAYLQGFQQSGSLLGVIKHFPGLGSSTTDPHRGLPIVYKSIADLEAHEFVPYKDLLKTGDIHAIMVTHMYLPEIDADKPATLSFKITTQILRSDLGFQGLIITDSLDMQALAVQYPMDQAALLAASAGADILMGPSTPDQVSAVIDTIMTNIDQGKITVARIDDSVRRILTEKIAMGVIPLPGPTPTPVPIPIHTPTPPRAPTPTPKSHK